jgi:hypothetical protein
MSWLALRRYVTFSPAVLEISSKNQDIPLVKETTAKPAVLAAYCEKV